MAVGRSSQLCYNTWQCVLSLFLQSSSVSGLPVSAVLFLEPASPRPSVTSPVALTSWADLQLPWLCAANSAGLGSISSPSRKPSSSIPSQKALAAGFWSPGRWAGSCVLLCTPVHYCALSTLASAYALSHRPFTHSLLCVLTSNPVCVWEQMNKAAHYSVTILDPLE